MSDLLIISRHTQRKWALNPRSSFLGFSSHLIPLLFGEGLPLLSFRLHLQFKWAITVYSFSHWETLAANDFHVSLGIIVIISTRIFGSPNFCSHLGSSLVLGLARKNISILVMSWLFACKTCKQGHKNEGHGSPSQLSLWPKSRVSKMTTSFKGTKKKNEAKLSPELWN